MLNHPVTLVTGGTGLIGGEVIVSLTREGRPVRALVRAGSPAFARRRLLERLAKSSGYLPRYADIIDVVPGDAALPGFGCSEDIGAGVGTIVHCAANTSFSERDRDSIWTTNVGGARNLVALARRSAPDARVVFVSTASVVTAPTGTCLPEDLPFTGHENAYTLSKREAERVVMTSGLDVVVVRPSIVLSRGVDDRTMARSILWAIPIMNELGDVPVDPDAFVDVVPADFVADAIARLAVKPRLAHRVYHISAGRDSHTFGQVIGEIVKENPEYGRIRLTGAASLTRSRSRLLRPITGYLPFINASIQYANDRLQDEIGQDGRAPASIGYVPELLSFISLDEAYAEMARP